MRLRREIAWRISIVTATCVGSVRVATFSASPMISSKRSAASISVLLPNGGTGASAAAITASLLQEVSASCSRFAVRIFKDILPVGINHLPEIGVRDGRFGDEIDIAPEERFERFGKGEKALRVAGRAVPEVDDEIEIARLWLEFAGCRRAEEIEPVDAEIPAKISDRGFLFGDQSDHRCSIRRRAGHAAKPARPASRRIRGG